MLLACSVGGLARCGRSGAPHARWRLLRMRPSRWMPRRRHGAMRGMRPWRLPGGSRPGTPRGQIQGCRRRVIGRSLSAVPLDHPDAGHLDRRGSGEAISVRHPCRHLRPHPRVAVAMLSEGRGPLRSLWWGHGRGVPRIANSGTRARWLPSARHPGCTTHSPGSAPSCGCAFAGDPKTVRLRGYGARAPWNRPGMIFTVSPRPVGKSRRVMCAGTGTSMPARSVS